jgi:hypothetical protein
MTNDQRLEVISTVKQLLGLVGENAAPKTLVNTHRMSEKKAEGVRD